ncbi:ABC-2 type transport system ATP-binding protein [Paenibacillus shirakamiensis]|uniref:ABC-2 type transport system ATP-binding protein n=1 Tax=Paenibacillus shirakamiensis TaxID=1265935 RepID=A0ABS4JL38_9BACL|nr:ABC transporter ATP-binding protein [Paenibacillus shirakamiensis]MBP2001686.1 ABC-2 type transport system ATP-binding protein [Paenibacillus shirakamiensis]
MNSIDTKGFLPLLDVHIYEAGYTQNCPKIKEISFHIELGSLTGLIGPNGAGKSTTLKAILGVLPYIEAKIEFHGAQNYAYIPEQPVFYDTLTLWEHLELAATVYGIDEHIFYEEANSLLEQFRMEDARDLFPAGFSKGMQQKMMLIIGFLAHPDIYIVDEPFVGLDPRATKDFLGLLESERARGAAVLMSTHVLDTAERICNHFVLISSGSIKAQGTLRDIQNQSGLCGGSLFDCFDKLT